jgi:hypothetical protein
MPLGVATLQVCGKFVLDPEDDEQCAEHLQQCSARHERITARRASDKIEVQLHCVLTLRSGAQALIRDRTRTIISRIACCLQHLCACSTTGRSHPII